MGRNYIEKRVIKSGIDLCKERIDQKGTPITAADLLDMKVRTISPVLQWFYILVGSVFIVFGIWTHTVTRNMAISFAPVLMGFANVAYAVHGRPRSVSELSKDLDLTELSADIVQRFVAEMDEKRQGNS